MKVPMSITYWFQQIGVYNNICVKMAMAAQLIWDSGAAFGPPAIRQVWNIADSRWSFRSPTQRTDMTDPTNSPKSYIFFFIEYSVHTNMSYLGESTIYPVIS